MIHPKLTSDLYRFFSQRITVQSQTQTVSDFGEVTSTWSDRDSLKNVRARVSGLSTKQMEQAQLSGYVVTNQVFIPGYHAAIQTDDRVVFESTNYEVREVQHDSAQQVTVLLVRRVDSPEDA